MKEIMRNLQNGVQGRDPEPPPTSIPTLERTHKTSRKIRYLYCINQQAAIL